MFLVETKTEYTYQLVDILYSYIYEGIYSIYQEALNINPVINEELKIFQELLRKVPKWNQNIINDETKRIKKMSNQGELIDDLIKAVIKANIMILTNTNPINKDKIKINHSITTEVFIHNCYIEVARTFFSNPYLLYHKYSTFELKKNQLKSYNLIKDCIKNAIRKMLPLNLILKEYIGESFNPNFHADDYENPIIESDKEKIQKMLSTSNKVLGSNYNFELVKEEKDISNNKMQIKLVTIPNKQNNNDKINDFLNNIKKNNNKNNLKNQNKNNKINDQNKNNKINDSNDQNKNISIKNSINNIFTNNDNKIKESEAASDFYINNAKNNIGEFYGNSLNIKNYNNYDNNSDDNNTDNDINTNNKSLLMSSIKNNKTINNIKKSNYIIKNPLI